MIDRFDEWTRDVAEAAPRRQLLRGLGGLALGSLGFLGLNQEGEAKNNNNKCHKCKKKCKRKNRKKNNNNNKKNCNNKCHNKCKNN